ncbi:hypothetical protein FGO68_gene12372 [Halteria grandinella]|uniref:Uncharacterized protein n=1 Tax=Halteria grandinella TaxID=5974 RepID=A0A8J8P5L8_HALGN|nr:hypothetical protein FGO68_gene12372 [Halteria grandinella]
MQQYGYIDPSTPNQRIRGLVDNKLKEQSSFSNNNLNPTHSQGVVGQQIEEAKANQAKTGGGLGQSQNANAQISNLFGGLNVDGAHMITVTQEGENWHQNTKSYQTGAPIQQTPPQVNFQSVRNQLTNNNVFKWRTNHSQSALSGQIGAPSHQDVNQIVQKYPIAQQDVQNIPHHLSTFKRRRSPQLPPSVINVNTTSHNQHSNLGQGSIKMGYNSTPQEYENVISGGLTRMGLGNNYGNISSKKKSNIQVNLTNLKESQLALQQLEDFQELDDNCDDVEAKRGLLSIIKRRDNSPKREPRHTHNANSNMSMRVPVIKLEALERPSQQRLVNNTHGIFGRGELPEGQRKFLEGLALAEAKENALKNNRNFSPSPVKIQQQCRFKNLQISDSEIQPQKVEDAHYEDFISDESASLLGTSEERKFTATSGLHTAVHPLIIEAKSNYQVLK